MDILARAVGIDSWPARAANPAMVVHLPGGAIITRWTDERRWDERRAAFGALSEPFWRWQECTADAVWNLALWSPPWPPQTPEEMAMLAAMGLDWVRESMRGGRIEAGRHLLQLAADALRPVATHLRDAPEPMRLFVDAQLLIAAQTTSRHANALYGAAALDLPRRGVVHLSGGMGVIAETLVDATRQNGGQVHYRQEVNRVVLERGRPLAVETKQGASFPADVVVANLPPWSIAHLLGDGAPRRSRSLLPPKDGWGAFVIYVGLDGSHIPADLPLHHQVVIGEPLGEGNTVFLSLSPAWDKERGPSGQRALTISTHTRLEPWWNLFERDRSAYEARKAVYTERVLSAAEVALPGLRGAARLILPGTPVSFQRFTRRAWGWVGGFPQTGLFRTWGPRLAPNLWMVGDSIFPGQSTAAAALGGLRVARTIAREQRLRKQR